MEVEWLILADSANVTGGKLNLLGGGWETVWVNDRFPHNQHLAVAVAFKVPWLETNSPHPFRIAIVAGDGDRELMKVEGNLEAGRPPGILPGQDQRAQVAVESIVELEQGTYSVIAGIGDNEKQLAFRVLPGPNLINLPKQV